VDVQPFALLRYFDVTTFDHTTGTASANWLNDVLKANGYLRNGEVVAVHQGPSRIGTTISSAFHQLEITYGANVAGDAPSTCLMKVGKPEWFAITKHEVAFYERTLRMGPTPGLLTAFATSVDEDLRSAVILLEDRTDCAAPSVAPLPPPIETCERAVRSLATVHSRWWNAAELRDTALGVRTSHPMLRVRSAADGVRAPSGTSHRTRAERTSDLLASFFDALGDRLSRERRAILERFPEQYDRIIADRIEQSSALTLAHGDAHFWNFLYPVDTSLPPVLIDWQTYFVNFAANDLAYMIALHWFRERRQRFEVSLLHAYHDQLERQDVEYPFDELLHDYRLQVAGLMFVPIIRWLNKLPASLWWTHLDNAFSAFDDLGCREFFQA